MRGDRDLDRFGPKRSSIGILCVACFVALLEDGPAISEWLFSRCFLSVAGTDLFSLNLFFSLDIFELEGSAAGRCTPLLFFELIESTESLLAVL